MTEIDTDKLVGRLRNTNTKGQEGLRLDAADAILAMAEENKRLREALGPFARHVGKDGEIIRLEWGKDHWTGTLSPEDFTRARRVLGKDKALKAEVERLREIVAILPIGEMVGRMGWNNWEQARDGLLRALGKDKA